MDKQTLIYELNRIANDLSENDATILHAAAGYLGAKNSKVEMSSDEKYSVMQLMEHIKKEGMDSCDDMLVRCNILFDLDKGLSSLTIKEKYKVCDDTVCKVRKAFLTDRLCGFTKYLERVGKYNRYEQTGVTKRNKKI